MRRRRFSLSFVAALVMSVAAAAQAQAVAPTVTTGAATTDSPNSTLFESTVDPHGCAVSIAYDYGTTTDFGQVVNSDQSAATGAQYNSAIAYGLEPGTSYYYRVTATTTDCGGGATGETGTGATKCFVKKSTTNDAENVACPAGTPGAETGTGGNTGGSTGGNTGGSTGGNTGGSTGGNTGGSTGGNTGGSTGDDSHAGNVRTPHIKGHRCVPTVKINFTLELITQGGLKCHTPFALLDTAHAHRVVGHHDRFKLGKFKCVAPWFAGTVAIYHCSHGKQGWYMSTFASGSWRAPNHVHPDW